MIEEIIDQTWWIIEQLLTDHFEEFVAIYKKYKSVFCLIKERKHKIISILCL